MCYYECVVLNRETNLKVKQALPDTAVLNDNINSLSTFDGLPSLNYSPCETSNIFATKLSPSSIIIVRLFKTCSKSELRKFESKNNDK